MVMSRFPGEAYGKKREIGSLKDNLCAERRRKIAAAVKPLVMEPMLNRDVVVRGSPFRGEYAFSITMVPFRATRTTPANPLSRCASTIPSRRAPESCAFARTDAQHRSAAPRTRVRVRARSASPPQRRISRKPREPGVGAESALRNRRSIVVLYRDRADRAMRV